MWRYWCRRNRSEASDQGKSIEIPANRSLALASEATSLTCALGEITIALNGVSIYSGAVDSSCTLLDVDDALSEWTSFDYCGGHAQNSGDYHYHFPPSCLVDQAGVLADGHSRQIGWAFDGFPIYGPFGVGGVAMTHSAQGCVGSFCLDSCSGLELFLPEVDDFAYRYYFTGSTSDLATLPGDPKPSSTDFPFTIDCIRGCTLSELGAVAAKCSASGYNASAHAPSPTTVCSRQRWEFPLAKYTINFSEPSEAMGAKQKESMPSIFVKGESKSNGKHTRFYSLSQASSSAKLLATELIGLEWAPSPNKTSTISRRQAAVAADKARCFSMFVDGEEEDKLLFDSIADILCRCLRESHGKISVGIVA